MKRWLYVVVTSLLPMSLTVQPAAANGGPVAWTATTVHSGIAPRQENDIRLVEEKLDIRLLDDFNHYRVVARYRLDNPKAARAIQYGVPINWEGRKPIGEAAKGVNITLNGQKHGCRPTEVSERVVKPEEDEGEGPTGTAWCVADLTIPTGSQNELVLEYTGEFEYVDWETSKSALTSFEDRKLRYELWPAGYWRGPVEQLDVRIDLGPYAGLVKLHNLPGAMTGDGKQLTKTFRNLDLKTFREINLTLDAHTVMHPHQLATWNRTAPDYERRPVKAKASSALAPQGSVRYEAKNLIDGNPGTAWCEGKADDGIGESFELHIGEAKSNEYYCRPEGLTIVPGYARSTAHFLNNNRIRKLRVSECDTPNDYRDVTFVKPATTAEKAAVMIYLDYDDHLPGADNGSDDSAHRYKVSGKKAKGEERSPPSCLRFTIMEVDPGAKYRDSCISEIAPVFNCG